MSAFLKQIEHLKAFQVSDQSLFTIFIQDKTSCFQDLRKIGNNIKNVGNDFKRRKLQNILGAVFEYLESGKTNYSSAVIFAGKFSNLADITVEIYPLPFPVKNFQHYSDDVFRIDLIKEEIEPSDKLGVVWLKPKKVAFYGVNKKISVVYGIESLEKKKIGEKINQYLKRPELVGILCCGTASDLQGLDCQNVKHTVMKHKVVSGRATFKSLEKELQQEFFQTKFQQELPRLRKLLNNLEEGKTVYGPQQVMQALEWNQLEYLYTCKSIAIDKGSCRIVRIPAALKEDYQALQEIGGVIGKKYF